MNEQLNNPSSPNGSRDDQIPRPGKENSPAAPGITQHSTRKITRNITRNITKKQITIALLAVLVSVLVLFAVYSIIDKKHPGQIDSKEEYLGDIETPAKHWLNGYLGVLTRFKQLGNINWLVLPLLIWFFTSKKIKKERWHTALLFVWLFTLAFIGFKGYYNFRYQLTLFPITSAMVLFLLWKLTDDKAKILKILCFSFIGLLCIFNIYHYRDLYKNYWELRVSVKTPHFPYRLMDYFNSPRFLQENTRVLTMNQPIFYYHTSLQGVDYVSPHAIQTWVDFNKKKGTVASREKLFQLIKRKLRVGYILMNKVQQRFQRGNMLEEFLHCECRLAIEDQGWLLYKLRENPLEKLLNTPAFHEFNLATEATEGTEGKKRTKGTEETGVTAGKNLKINAWNNSQSEVNTVSPPLHRFFKIGKYKYTVNKDQKTRIIIVSLEKPAKTGDSRLHFGYQFNRKGLDIDPGLYEGKYVTFIVRLAASPSLPDKDTYIAIVDYNKDGSRSAEKAYFTSTYWRTYLVSKKVNPGNDRLLLLFRFRPLAAQDKFKIKDVKIIISKEPL